MATFVNDLRLTELATGEGSGTWGTTTNTNLSLIGESFSFGTEAITTNADTHTTTIADGSTDPGRSLFLKYTGTLDSACTITIGPNTVSKLWFIENATSGSQNIIISQGSGADITIPNGQTKAIYSDGAGSGAAMVDAFQDLSIPDLFVDDDLTVGDDLILSSDSAIIKFGADADTTLTHTDGSGLTLNSTNKIMFNDASQFIQGSSATVLSLGATDEIDLTATAIDVNGTIDVSGNATLGGTLGVTGAVTANAGISIDNITIDGTEIDLSSGDLTIDVAGDIILDANGADVLLKDDGTTFGEFTNSSTDFVIKSSTSDKDMLFKGNDGGSEITALTLDMSAAGAATFNDKITAVGTSVFTNLDISGDIDVDGTTNLDVVDIDGAVDMASTLAVGGVVTANAGVVVDNITIDGTEIDLSSGDLTVDVAGDIKLDAGGSDIRLEVAGTQFGKFTRDSGDFVISSSENDKDIKFAGADGGSDITALTLDMSEAGDATFNAGVGVGGASPGANALVVRADTDKNMTFSSAIGETGNVITIQGTNNDGTSMAGIGLAGSSIVLERGPVSINDNGGDFDFKVESDNKANMFGINAGSDYVYVGTDEQAQGGSLNINSVSGSPGLSLFTRSATDGDTGILTFLKTPATSGNYTATASGDVLGDIRFTGVNTSAVADIGAQITATQNGTSSSTVPTALTFISTEVQHLKLDGSVVINETGADLDVRIETDARSSGFVIDASTDNVGFMVTPVTDSLSSFNAVQFGQTGMIQSRQANPSISVNENVYRASSGSTGYKAIITQASSMITQAAGEIVFYANASASAGADVTLSQQAVIDTNGLSVGTTTTGNGSLSVAGVLALEPGGQVSIDASNGRPNLARNADGELRIAAGKDSNGFITFHVTPSGSTNVMERFKMADNITFTGRSGTSPIFSLVNVDTEDVNTGRETSIRFSGFRSGGESVDNAQISGNHVGSADDDKGGMIFYTNGGSGLGERMRIDNAGIVFNEDGGDQDFRVESDTDTACFFVDAGNNTVCFGSTSPQQAARFFCTVGTSKPGYLTQNLTTGSTNNVAQFMSNGESVIGTINATNTATAYNTSSDYRLKENVETLKDGLDRLNQLKPVQFTWTTDGSLSEGFIAHEVEDLFPDAVSGEKDAVDEEGNIDPQQVDYGRITPLLVKAIQEQQEQIEELKAEVAKLKGE